MSRILWFIVNIASIQYAFLTIITTFCTYPFFFSLQKAKSVAHKMEISAKNTVYERVIFISGFNYHIDKRHSVENPETNTNKSSMKICANICSADEAAAVLAKGGDGIGLFRSEFLYFESACNPAENEQFAVYKNLLEAMPEKPVIIRTVDIGADKKLDFLNSNHEENPALGCRSIRFCLTHPEIFKTQLRALLRASVYGNLGIMFPMITSAHEITQIKRLLKEVKYDLKNDGHPYSETVKIGIMIETPAAAIISDELAPLVDFFSVGTNDLTQFTLACDRQNPELEPFLDTHHKAVLRLIEMAAKSAHKAGIRIGICGELAADTSLTETFLKIGIDELSVSVPFIPSVKAAASKKHRSDF